VWRWFKALPSRRFGPAPPITWQQATGLQIIEASTLGQGSDSAAKASAEDVSGDQELLAVRITEPCHMQTFFEFRKKSTNSR